MNAYDRLKHGNTESEGCPQRFYTQGKHTHKYKANNSFNKSILYPPFPSEVLRLQSRALHIYARQVLYRSMTLLPHYISV